MQSTLGRDIQFIQGLPDLSNDLREINPKFNSILVFDDLMSQATESDDFYSVYAKPSSKRKHDTGAAEYVP